MKKISEKALLVNLNIKQWTARKTDKAVTQKVEQEHNTHNAGAFSKILIAETELKKVQKVATSMRTFLYDNTLPWGDNGDRLLPSTNYLPFSSQYKQYLFEFEYAVDSFITQYPMLKEEARNRLNGMFRESDYPHLNTMKGRFSMQINYLPLADAEDFRLKVDSDEVDYLKEQIEDTVNDRITQATKSIWIRIGDAVGHMVEKLNEKDGVFRDTLVSNIEDLINVMPRLNFTNDPDINATINEMKALLVAPDRLRTNNKLRKEKAEEARAILDKINGYL